MGINEFHESAKAPGKKSSGKKEGSDKTTKDVVTRPKAAPAGPRGLAPKPPFGMYVPPVATNAKPVAHKPLDHQEKTEDEG